jgi:hypothetical protein
LNTPPFIASIGQSSLAEAIQFSPTAFPWIESTHVLALSIVVGAILIVDLRLIGIGAHRRGARRLIVELLPFTWVAFVVAVVSGGLMFISNASMYWDSSVFLAKMVAIALAGLNMAVFHLTAHRRIADWDEVIPPPAAARLAGVVSLCLWVVIVFLGRWIGFSAPFV